MKPDRHSAGTAVSLLLLLTLSLFSRGIFADAKQIEAAVTDFLLEETLIYTRADQRVEIELGYMDPRLKLPGCDSALDVGLNGAQRLLGKIQVKVRCPSNQGWTKYVPAHVRIYSQVLVSTDNLARGTVITESVIDTAEIELSTMRRTPITSLSEVVGQELKYPLTAGAPYFVEGVVAPTVVRRGDQVQLIAQSDRLQIRQIGEALQDGEVGKLINVRNSSSEIVVQAEVVAPGKVKVLF